MTLNDRIHALKKSLVLSGKKPTEVHIPLDLELELEGSPGLNRSTFMVQGPRAFTHVDGLRIIWDAPKLLVR